MLPEGVEADPPAGAEVIPVADVGAAISWLRASSSVNPPVNDS
jgi:hypothetical protein